MVTDPKAKTLGVWQGTQEPGFAIKKFKDWTSIYVGFAPVPPKILSNIARLAGVHMYTDRRDIVYGNATYLAVVADGDGKRRINLREPMHNAETRQLLEKNFSVKMENGETLFLKGK